MASLFWVGGTANYDGTTNHFATTTGGTATVAAVTSADTVTFDSNSGTGTVTMTANWSSGSVTFNQTGLTLTTNGTVTFTIATASSLTLTNGTINTNGSTCSWGGFALGVGTKTLTLGATPLTLTGAGTQWNASSNGTNFTLNANTSTINGTAGTTLTFSGNSLTYNNLASTGSITISAGNNIFNNFTMNPASATGPILTLGGDQTINGVLTLTGLNSGTTAGRVAVASSVPGFGTIIRTLTVNGSTSLTNVDFGGITAAGTAIPLTGTGIGDAGSNTNITADAPRTLYWILAGGSNVSTLANWSLSTGGVTANTAPRPQDTCIFDANSFTGGGTLSVSIIRWFCKDMDFSNVAVAPSINIGSFNCAITGSLTLKSGMTTSSSTTTSLTFAGQGTHTITTAGTNFQFNLQIHAGVGTYTMQDGLTLTNANTLTHQSGTFTANNKNISTGLFVSGTAQTRVINMGSGTWTLSGTTGTIWSISAAGMTLNPSSSTISITDTGAVNKTFAGFSLTYNNLAITSGGSGAILLTNNSTWNDITINAPKTLIMNANTTQTVNSFTATGTAGNLITLQSGTGGTKFNLSKASGIVSCDYLSLTDSNATGGASWYAGANSTNVSNNTGWIFAAAPSGTPNMLLMGIG